jgi:uncharacterized protein (DUF1684 family)
MPHRTPPTAEADEAAEPDRVALAGWRRAVAELYAAVRAEPQPRRAHELWRRGRDELFARHPQSPLPAGDPLRRTGLPYFPYDPALRFEVSLQPVPPASPLTVQLPEGPLRLEPVGRLALDPLGFELDVWWLGQYGGGLFVPLRDGTAGTQTYGGGRYLLDAAKGADLGDRDGRLIVDLNFLYHPSCRYSPEWICPLAPEGNTTPVPVAGGERL